MNYRQRAIDELKEKGKTSLKANGNSMMPLIKSGSTVNIERQINYEKGDVVLCKVKGNVYIHKVYGISEQKGYLIGNNSGHINGWTKHVYGKWIK